MATLAVGLRKGDLVVTYTTILSFKKVTHGVLGRSLFDPDEYIRVTKLATVPDRMLFMGEDDVGHPLDFRFNGKIRGHFQIRFFRGNTFQIVDRFVLKRAKISLGGECPFDPGVPGLHLVRGESSPIRTS